MKLLTITLFIFYLKSVYPDEEIIKDKSKCDSGTLIYQELGCTPVYKNKKCCPAYYDCRKYDDPANKCRYKNVDYPIEAKIEVDSPCLFGCHCGLNYRNEIAISCAMPRCFIRPAPNETCYSIKTDSKGCCNYDWKCPPFDNLQICKFGNKTVKEGELFVPSNTCSQCLCQKGFQGKYVEPFCKKINCGLEVWNSEALKNNCAPIYYSYETPMCCPSGFVCPEYIKHEIKFKENQKKVNYPPCNFGDKKIPYRTKFDAISTYESINSNISCICSKPPLLTCTYLE